MENPGNEKVSITAWATAHARTFTDIPYSKEIFEMLEKKRASLGQSDLSTKMKETSLALLIEGRYKMIDKVIAENGFQQVLEVAAGLIQRGFIMTGDPLVTYVELDLPGIASEKREMIRELEAVESPRGNLHIESGNALSMDDLRNACRHFDRSKPLAIVCEGLLRYFSFEEKETIARHFHALLKEFGGMWITPDVSLKRKATGKNSMLRRQFNESVEKMTGVEIEPNLFKSKEHAIQFFTDLGFDVETRSYSEIENRMTCPKILGVPETEVKDAMGAVLLVMRVK